MMFSSTAIFAGPAWLMADRELAKERVRDEVMIGSYFLGKYSGQGRLVYFFVSVVVVVAQLQPRGHETVYHAREKLGLLYLTFCP